MRKSTSVGRMVTVHTNAPRQMLLRTYASLASARRQVRKDNKMELSTVFPFQVHVEQEHHSDLFPAGTVARRGAKTKGSALGMVEAVFQTDTFSNLLL